MNRVYFAQELETAASWWRIYRRDGVTLGFTTHDRDLYFGGVLHRSAPGLLPSAVRRTIRLSDDEAEVEGGLGHDTIREIDIANGRFDEARIESGIVDWQTLEYAALYNGSISAVSRDATGFSAHLRSAKADLNFDPVPRASPSCRARFCGPGCGLPAEKYTTRSHIVAVDHDANSITLDHPMPAQLSNGELRFIDGPQAGSVLRIIAVSGSSLELDAPLGLEVASGMRVMVREGCEKTIDKCATRFANAINFQGEPHLPGNDLLAQYPQPR